LDDHSDRDLQSRNPWPEPRCPCFRPEAVVEQLEAEEVEAEMALDVLVTSCWFLRRTCLIWEGEKNMNEMLIFFSWLTKHELLSFFTKLLQNRSHHLFLTNNLLVLASNIQKHCLCSFLWFQNNVCITFYFQIFSFEFKILSKLMLPCQSDLLNYIFNNAMSKWLLLKYLLAKAIELKW
jgi:hypothetical protein